VARLDKEYLMRKFWSAGVAALVALSLMLTIAPATLAEDFECRGTVGADTIVGNLLVPDDATCTLNGTIVQGGIVVKSRASLFATGIQATGGLQGESPTKVILSASRLGNSVSVRKGGATKVDPDTLDIRDQTYINGDLQLEENVGSVSLADNDIVGSIQANKNTGGLVITGNRIGNGLQCQDNNPPPTGGGNIAKQAQGQCINLVTSTTSPQGIAVNPGASPAGPTTQEPPVAVTAPTSAPPTNAGGAVLPAQAPRASAAP